MVADPKRNLVSESSRQITDGLLQDLHGWLSPLKQALSLEAERGFGNLLGRDEHFHSFVSRELSSPPNYLHKNNLELKKQLLELAESFSNYQNSTDSARRRIVAKTRKLLYKLTKELTPSIPSKNPTLRINDSTVHSQLESNCILKEHDINTPLVAIKGIGPKLSDRLASLGILLIRDLLQYYPRDYVDYSSLKRIAHLQPGETVTVLATIRRCSAFKSPRNVNLSILELQLQDSTGRLKVTKFFGGKRFSNYSYLHSQASLYPIGSTVAVSGLVKKGPYGKSIQDPLIEVLENPNSQINSKFIGRLLPVYNLTEGITANKFRDLIDIVLPFTSEWSDPLSPGQLKEHSLITKSEAMNSIHKPLDQKSLRSARRRLVFDEFLLLQLGLLRRRSELRKSAAPALNISVQSEGLVDNFFRLLPFELTKAQTRVLLEIESDLKCTKPMARLVQGDVGSGKTVVAIAALLNAVQAGWQGAFMAPTEVLAQQHYRTLCKWLPNLHVTVELLSGSTPRVKRSKVLDDLANGSLKILVGTHALIEERVSFSRLGLVVVDEQHRFGVHQRNRLLNKGLQPHLLTMTATPIPRTLALSIHGDLDVSQIDELPPGRTPIKTKLLTNSNRDKAYELIRSEVNRGQRAYVVLPLVEESEKLDLRSAVEVYEHLSTNIFKELSVGLLHGRMNSSEKAAIISDFTYGNCQVLVSTTVVEVGVDVPEATVMVIEHADRFGLAQLHQLRGRVGRGAKTSYCVLLNDGNNPLSKQRLEVLVNTNDGFEISEIDLRLRGPGQVLGTRQSGLPDFALASLVDDVQVLEEARQAAVKIMNIDPELQGNLVLRNLLEEYWNRLIVKAQLN